jgi:alkylhydroperoxidase/carboxymuconolactone decarboxylase family protein YurZ
LSARVGGSTFRGSSCSTRDIAPTLADLTDRVLFGEVWARPQLSQRDRSVVTISA